MSNSDKQPFIIIESVPLVYRYFTFTGKLVPVWEKRVLGFAFITMGLGELWLHPFG